MGGDREHGVADLADRPAGDIETADQTGQPDQPTGINGPLVLLLEVRDYSRREGFGGHGIPEDPVVDPLVQGFEDRRGRTEIHIRHPQWQDVAPLVSVPFNAGRMAAIDTRVKIKAGWRHLSLQFPGGQFGDGVLELPPGFADHKGQIAGFGQQPKMRSQHLL